MPSLSFPPFFGVIYRGSPPGADRGINGKTFHSLYEMLPLELTFEDYNGTEKISYLPKPLTTDGEPDSFDPDTGDFCLYAPWGNLSIFYQDFQNSSGLISLGKIEEGMDVISAMEDDFAVTLTKTED